MRLLTVLFIFAAFTSFSQTKIGYVNSEYILSYVPEVQNATKTLNNYKAKLEQSLFVKQQELTNLNDEITVKKYISSTDQSELKELQLKAHQLSAEIQKLNEDATYKYANKEHELMAPLIKRVEKAINEVRKELGFDIILKQDIIVSADPNLDITGEVMKKLEISVSSY